MKTLVALILSSIENGAPSGHLYAALMGRYSLDTYNAALAILKDCKLIESSGHFLTLTPKGKELAEKVNRAIGA